MDPKHLSGPKELAYTQARMEEQWALDLKCEAEAKYGHKPPASLLSKPWYNRKVWLAHLKAKSSLYLWQ